MFKCKIDEEIKKEFEETLQKIITNNRKELFDLELELSDTKERLEKTLKEVEKYKKKYKELENMIIEYDMEVYNEFKQKRKK